MSEYFTNRGSVTLVLIGNGKDEKRKTNLIVLLHAILSGKTLEDFASKNYTLPTPDKSSDLPRYCATAKNGTVIELIDAPPLDAGGTQAAKITKVVTSLPKFDALVVVLERSEPKLASDVERLLDQLFGTFPRSLRKNIVFLFTIPDKEIGAPDVDRTGLPEWVDKKQVVLKPIADVVKIRAEAVPGSTDEDLRRELDGPFKNSITRLEPLWQFIKSSGVQNSEIKNLYLQAANIESQMYQLLADDPNLTGDKAMHRMSTLVGEYEAVATTPDFITHLELVIQIIRTGPKEFSIKADIQKLEKARARLKAAENRSDKYPRWHVIC